MKTVFAVFTYSPHRSRRLADGGTIYATLLRYAKGKYGPNSIEIKDFVATGEGKLRKKKTAAK